MSTAKDNLKAIDPESGMVTAMCVVGYILYIGFDSGSIKTFKLPSASEEGELKSHTGVVTCISTIGTLLASSSADLSICIWNMSDNSLMNRIQTDVVMTKIDSFVQKSLVLAYNEDGELRGYDYGNGVEKHKMTMTGDQVKLSILGKFTFKSKVKIDDPDAIVPDITEDSKSVREKEILSKVSQKRKPKMHRVIGDVPGFEGDGVFIIASMDNHVLQLWDLDSETKLNELDSHNENHISTLKSTKDGFVISGAKDGKINYFA